MFQSGDCVSNMSVVDQSELAMLLGTLYTMTLKAEAHFQFRNSTEREEPSFKLGVVFFGFQAELKPAICTKQTGCPFSCWSSTVRLIYHEA
jgi:hypothetical protein